jgi:hypothetical protein
VSGTFAQGDALKRLRMGFMHFADNKDVASAASSVEGLLFCAGDKGGSLLPQVRAACCLRWCREKGERTPLNHCVGNSEWGIGMVVVATLLGL